MEGKDTKRFSLRTLDVFRFGFFGLAVMALTAFMTSIFTEDIPALADETFYVNTADDQDDGFCDEVHCSLREAIKAANIKVNGDSVDRIYFEIEGDGVHEIALTKSLPTITDPVIIDATTNPGYEGEPLVLISGKDRVSQGFVITGGETEIRGLKIVHFRNAGIEILGYGGNKILANHICTDGVLAQPNAVGIHVDGSSGNIIGGLTEQSRNVISGCERVGIHIENSMGTQNLIQGNDIGVNKNGILLTSPMGILIEDSSGNTIGGPSTGEKNLIATGDGISHIVLTGEADGGTFVEENNYTD